jgi:hypothetical protein
LTSAATLSKTALKGPVTAAIQVVGKPLRDVNFWGKALTIYGSYKVHQVKSKIGSINIGKAFFYYLLFKYHDLLVFSRHSALFHLCFFFECMISSSRGCELYGNETKSNRRNVEFHTRRE